MPLHVSSTYARHQEVKIALHSLWYHHTETSEWSKITKIQFYKYKQIVAKFISSVECLDFGVVGLEWYPCCRLKPATRIPFQPNHTETPTHIESRTTRPMW